MKLNNKLFLILIAFSLLGQSCSDSFLELKPRGTDLEENYYRNRQEAYNGLVAAYEVVGVQSTSYVTKILAASAASDGHLAAGGGASALANIQPWSRCPV